ncbi:aminoglycoside phosphotransferase family protein [Nocardia sp. NPDC046763]|uniref:aminoglycoside phosphotransferase family protein n=1 Tax=Nocardia sp. NPDC046763 TaxID=3155256 RepID=UPI0033EA0142
MTGTISLQPILDDACRQLGLSSTGARLLHAHSNTVYLLPREQAIARISGNDHAGLAPRASLAITRWLAQQGVPVTEPLIDRAADVDGMTVTIWHYYPQCGRDAPPAGELARILRTLHALPGEIPFALRDYIPLQGLTNTLRDPHASSALTDDERGWLDQQTRDHITAYHRLRSHLGRGLVHGDAYLGNTLWGPDRLLLGDWDEISIAPRELDLVNTYQSVRFGALEEDDLDQFCNAYGWDVRGWEGFEALRSMRDLHTLNGYVRRASRGDQRAAQELRTRIRSLREPTSKDTPWHAVD